MSTPTLSPLLAALGLPITSLTSHPTLNPDATSVLFAAAGDEAQWGVNSGSDRPFDACPSSASSWFIRGVASDFVRAIAQQQGYDVDLAETDSEGVVNLGIKISAPFEDRFQIAATMAKDIGGLVGCPVRVLVGRPSQGPATAFISLGDLNPAYLNNGAVDGSLIWGAVKIKIERNLSQEIDSASESISPPNYFVATKWRIVDPPDDSFVTQGSLRLTMEVQAGSVTVNIEQRIRRRRISSKRWFYAAQSGSVSAAISGKFKGITTEGERMQAVDDIVAELKQEG